MVIHLRPYQHLALYHLGRSLEAGAWRQYLDLPTGAGKSTLAAAFAAQRLKQAPGRVLTLVYRQNLALQLAETLRQEGLEVGGHGLVNDLVEVPEVVVHRALGQRARVGHRPGGAAGQPVAGQYAPGRLDDLALLVALVGRLGPCPL